MTLTLQALREANIARVPSFRNRKGELVDCSTWDLSRWSNATLGELGEAANIVKHIEVGDLTLEEARPLLAAELADTLVYLSLYANFAGIDLAAATIEKFNAVSIRCKSPVRLVEG
jgi:NTP pyrophosphatase (non-canonical NTP hydrolase)